MKKIVSLLLAALMLLGLCACGSSAGYDDAMSEEGYYAYDAAESADYGAYEDYADYAVGAAEAYKDTAATVSSTESVNLDAEKIIYSGDAEIETQDFDACCQAIRQMIDECGGFLESSTVRGTDYYVNGCRSAEYVIRLPREQFQSVTDNLSDFGNVTYCSVDAQNISAEYRDTESRLAVYRTEEERLLAMLEVCETVEDMLNIEDRLAEVRYDIESLTSSLKNWDSLISFSTLTLCVDEVEEYTPEPEESYWQNIGRRFVNTLKGVGEGVAELFAFLIAALPVLVLLGLLAWGVVLLAKRGKKRRAKKKAEKAEEKKSE